MKNKFYIVFGIVIGVILVLAYQSVYGMFQTSCAKYGYDFDGFGFYDSFFPEPLCRVDEHQTSLYHLMKLYPNIEEGLYEEEKEEKMIPPNNLPTPPPSFEQGLF